MTEAELRNGIDKIIRNNDIDTAIVTALQKSYVLDKYHKTI